MQTTANQLHQSQDFTRAKDELMKVIFASSQKVAGIRPSQGGDQVRTEFNRQLQEFNQQRGRELYFPYIASGIGSGPYVELLDGSVKYDMITGIGINFFGHSHPELISEMICALPADTMQGNLQPGIEARELLNELLSTVGPKSRIKNGWFTSCGTMANEIALKMIRQKKHPATKILAFKDCFLGRSTAMQEITDNPSYRVGQPTYGEVFHLSFYDSKLGLEKSIERTLSEMKEWVARYGPQLAAIEIELVQGEGGFNYAPREFYVRVFEEAKKANLAIWVDEVQTFGRTGEVFALQKLDLEEYPDIITVGKMLQACAVLSVAEMNPKPGLVAGTFSGSTVALRTGRKTLQMLKKNNLIGKEGKISQLAEVFRSDLSKLAETTLRGKISDLRVFGGMIAFVPYEGKLDQIKKILLKLFDLGVVAFYCGHGPHLIRMLPPLGAMEEKHVHEICQLIERAVIEAQS